MKKGLLILSLFTLSCLSAQENSFQSVYFEFDKFELNKTQTNSIIDIVNSPGFLQNDAIQLYGYCDDRGSEDYNDKLSNKRVATVQQILLSNGVPLNKIFICEGRGRVVVNKDSLKNLEKTRYKNRRVDLIFIKSTVYNSFPENPKVGDVIVLNKIMFEMGSSALSLKAKKELDIIALKLTKKKTLRFEIKGHVCCTSNKFTDAIDNETQKNNLSENRARNVFNYFRSTGISPYRMSYKGYGNQFPLGKGDDLDRRVELAVTKL
jgi:outer membrane protein OmpA-like peptidoglycan-associated protein